MDKVFYIIKMAKYLKAILKKITNKDMESKYSKMVISMKAISKKI